VSRFVIKSDHGVFIVRAGNKQLTFATEDQTLAQALPLTPAEIMARLEKGPPVSVVEPKPPPEALWRSVVTVALVCAGVVLMVFALKPLFESQKAGRPDDITFVIGAAELASRRTAVVGIYATGQTLGDRHMMVSPDGHIVFSELGPRQSIGAGADSYRIGERNQRTCLVTPRSGVIEAVDADTLLYYGDVYRRIKSAP
jgi:hypothetical protein